MTKAKKKVARKRGQHVATKAVVGVDTAPVPTALQVQDAAADIAMRLRNDLHAAHQGYIMAVESARKTADEALNNVFGA